MSGASTVSKVGVGICAYNRPDYLRQCLASLKGTHYDYAFIVVDGGGDKFIQVLDVVAESGIAHKVFHANQGIAKIKNNLFTYLLLAECEHMFLIEDDNIITDKNVFQEYIDYAMEHELYHMNFGLHSPLNKDRGKFVEWNGKKVWVYPHVAGAFSYYHKNVIEKVGLLDERFYNAIEHVEHTWRIAVEGMTTPFYQFADHPNAAAMLQEIPGSIKNSTIRNRPDFHQLVNKGFELFMEKHEMPFPMRPKNA